MDYKEWVPDEAVEALTLQRALQDVEDPMKMAAQLFKEALPIAVMSMTHMAIHSPTEVIRLQASKYVIERSMGAVRNDVRMPDERPAWEQLFESIAVETDKIVDKKE